MPNKGKLIVSNILIIFGFLSLVAGIVMLILQAELIIGIISAFLTALISLAIGFYFWKTSDHPIVERPKTVKPIRAAKPMKNKTKKPFISDKEWKEFEEEDDEMMFVEEVLEDD